MKRSKHTLSHYRLQSIKMGGLYPINCQEVLPGDTFQCSTDMVVRFSPLNTPVMHPVMIRLHHFFVPNRLVWDGWEDFITGESDTTPPTGNSPSSKDDVRHYLGIPPRGAFQVNEFALRSYNMIWNEWFRDQDLQPERPLSGAPEAYSIPNVAWEKDYFTAARPWTQKGGEVTLPLGSNAPVTTDQPVGQQLSVYATDDDQWRNIGTGAAQATLSSLVSDPSEQLYADLSAATAINVNDLRTAFGLQRYQEARARYGSRYTEYLRYLGVSPSDARLQRPELLGGGVTRANFSEVLQTGPRVADNSGVGDLFGHGIAGFKGNRFRRFFEEHGTLLSLCSVRPKAVYTEGLPRHFLKRTKEDYFQKELQFIGQQAIDNDEVYMGHDSSGEAFGFTDRYREYRECPSMVLGDFRDTLNTWHLGRSLPSDTVLNSDFIECDPSDRIFQVGEGLGDTLWCMINNHMVARRIVSKSAKARVI